MPATSVTISGKFTVAGTAAQGSVEFVLAQAVQDGANDEIREPVPIVAGLQTDGSFSVALYATDDPGLVPSGVLYKVTEKILSAPTRTYLIEVPAAAAGTGLNLADIVPATTATLAYPYALSSDLDALDTRVTTLEDAPAGSTTSGPPAVTTIAASGASQALAFSDTAETVVYDITLDQDCAFTITGGTAGKRSLVELRLHPNGHQASWPTMRWPSRIVPTLSTGTDALDILVFATVDAAATIDGRMTDQNSLLPAVPDAPTGVSATGGNAQVVLSWLAALPNGATVTNYKVYRGTSAGAETLLTTVGNVLAYTDATAANGTAYFYKVSAVNAVGEGAKSSEVSATPADTGTTIISDTFTRADSSTSLGTTDTGQTYTIYGGTWGIASNKAKMITAANLTMCAAVLDTGVVDRTIQADITFAPNFFSAGLVARAQDSTNNLFVLITRSGNSFSDTHIELFKTVAGTQTSLAASAEGTSPALGTTHTCAIKTEGPVVTVLIDGASVLAYTLTSAEQATFLATDTHGGLKEWFATQSANADSGATTFDNLAVIT